MRARSEARNCLHGTSLENSEAVPARPPGRAPEEKCLDHRHGTRSTAQTFVVEALASVPVSSAIESPVVGTIWKILIAVGDDVAKGDDVMILESMKMEIPVEATAAGTIAAIAVAEGNNVDEGDTLAIIGD